MNHSRVLFFHLIPFVILALQFKLLEIELLLQGPVVQIKIEC